MAKITEAQAKVKTTWKDTPWGDDEEDKPTETVTSVHIQMREKGEEEYLKADLEVPPEIGAAIQLQEPARTMYGGFSKSVYYKLKVNPSGLFAGKLKVLPLKGGEYSE